MVVDDSAFMRKIIGDMINKDKDIEVIAKARNGVDALEKLEKIRPDVITLDVEMPKMNGIETLEKIQKNYKIPVIMVSSLTAENSKTTIEALEKGALDFIPKPSGPISLDIGQVEKELVQKIQSVIDMKATSKRSSQRVKKHTTTSIDKKWSAIVIGASTGGPRTITGILKELPENPEATPIFIVQHMPKGFTASFAQRLDSSCALKVVEAQDGEPIQSGRVYIAPGDFHMTLDKYRIHLDKREKHLGVRPSVDHLFTSAAPIYKDKLLSIVLTGMGKDGTQGMKETKKWGGGNIAQDQQSSVIFGMPSSAIHSGSVDRVLSLEGITRQLYEIVKG